MIILFMDSFDNYATADILTKWTSKSASAVLIQSTTKRTGVQALSVAGVSTTTIGYITKSISANCSTAMWGMAVRFETFNSYQFMVFTESGTDQLSICCNTDGTLTARKGDFGGTVLGTTTNSLSLDQWYYLEVKVTFATSGSVYIYVNGIQWLLANGDTTYTAN